MEVMDEAAASKQLSPQQLMQSVENDIKAPSTMHDALVHLINLDYEVAGIGPDLLMKAERFVRLFSKDEAAVVNAVLDS